MANYDQIKIKIKAKQINGKFWSQNMVTKQWHQLYLEWSMEMEDTLSGVLISDDQTRLKHCLTEFYLRKARTRLFGGKCYMLN